MTCRRQCPPGQPCACSDRLELRLPPEAIGLNMIASVSGGKDIDPTKSAHYVGDSRELLRLLPDACVQTVITSPPYFALRDYGVAGQIGLEATPELYIEALVGVFRDVRRVLKDDGTLWLNLGDSYSHGGCGSRDATRWPKQSRNAHMPDRKYGSNEHFAPATNGKSGEPGIMPVHAKKNTGCKEKDLLGIPWMAAFALRADGWYLRSEIIWAKPNPMPESIGDRPTKSHETIFLLSKSATYHYDADAISEPSVEAGRDILLRDKSFSKRQLEGDAGRRQRGSARKGDRYAVKERRNKRSVWSIPTQPFHGAHFACFPPALIEPMVLAGSRPGDLILDPFFGSGTTGQVAEKHGRLWIGFDIQPAYSAIADRRTAQRSLVLPAMETDELADELAGDV